MTPEQKQFCSEAKAVLENINRDMHRLEGLLKAMEPKPRRRKDTNWEELYENMGFRRRVKKAKD